RPHGPSVLPSTRLKVWAPTTTSFGALSRGPCTPCVRFDAAVTGSTATRGSGWWSAFPGRDSSRGAASRTSMFYCMFPPPRLGLAHQPSAFSPQIEQGPVLARSRDRRDHVSGDPVDLCKCPD